MKKKKYINYFSEILLIRSFENLLLRLFKQGHLTGTTHTCIGQEATPVIALSKINSNDFVISNHRSHGHFLAYSKDASGLLKELLGKEGGVCKGVAGSQHIHYKNFMSNGVLGNLTPVAAGIALSNKLKKQKGITYIFLGDGTFGQGVLYETLNIASLKNLRCVFIVENNRIAQTTDIKDNLAGTIKNRLNSFEIKTFETNSNNVNHLDKTFEKVKNYINKTSKPCGIIVESYRFASHSKGDDTRSKKYLKEIRNSKDPLKYLKKYVNNVEEKKIIKETEKLMNKLCAENNITI